MFTGWSDYSELLGRMAAAPESWAGSPGHAELDRRLRQSVPEAFEPGGMGGYGFDTLCAEVEHDYASNMDKVAQRIMFAARCRPAAEYYSKLVSEYGYDEKRVGDDWQGYFLCEQADGLAYSAQQFAEPGQWEPVERATSSSSASGAHEESALNHDADSNLWYDADHWYLPDKTTRVSEDADIDGFFRDESGNLYLKGKPADLSVDHFDRKEDRWRHRAPTGEFEYFNAGDNAWERKDANGLWQRKHEAAGRWLPYDAPSGMWLSDNRWQSYDEVGRPAAAEPAAPGEPAQTGTPRQDAGSAAAQDPYADFIGQLLDELPGGLESESVDAIIAFTKQTLNEMGGS